MNTYANQIIDAIGGTAKAAELCGVTPGAVSQWRNNGIPKTTLKFLRLAKPKAFAESLAAAGYVKQPVREAA